MVCMLAEVTGFKTQAQPSHGRELFLGEQKCLKMELLQLALELEA